MFGRRRTEAAWESQGYVSTKRATFCTPGQRAVSSSTTYGSKVNEGLGTSR